MSHSDPLRAKFTRFRIRVLLIGRANAGKMMLPQRVCNATEDSDSCNYEIMTRMIRTWRVFRLTCYQSRRPELRLQAFEM
jgi:hypothetical protein